jgi:pentose-5-phosphate-3-epimerase
VFAISTQTDLNAFDYWYQYYDIRHIQVMGIVTIGKQGEPFSESSLQIIDTLRKKYVDIDIMVDGGVSISILPRLLEQGVSSAVAGSAVFSGDVTQNLHALQNYGTL